MLKYQNMSIQERALLGKIMVTEATNPGCRTKLHINCKLKSDWLNSNVVLGKITFTLPRYT